MIGVVKIVIGQSSFYIGLDVKGKTEKKWMWRVF